MYNTSLEFNEAIKSSSREFKSKVLIGEDEYSDDKVINFSIEQSMAPSDEFSLGAFSSTKFELSIFLDDIRTNKIIKPFIGIKVGQGFEYVPLGVFNIENKSIKNGVVTVTCYDNAGKFEKPYFSDLTYPATLQSVANEICTKAGMKLAGTLPSLSIDNKIDGYTCREALSFIASACGGFAIANRTGDIEIKTVGTSTSSITGDNYFTFETDDKFTIKKVTAHIDKENVISRGEGIGVEEIEFSNPIANDSIMNHVYSKVKDYSYIPAKLVWQGNPSIDIGEKMIVTDIGAIKHDILVMRNKIVYEGGLRSEISSLAKSLGQSNFNYNGNMQGAIDRVTAEQIVVKELLADKADIGQLNAINANIENLTVSKADIEQLQATNANIENLKANKANISDLNATNAVIQNLQATKADIVDLTAATGKITVLESDVAKIGVLEGDVANIQDIIGGNISSDNIQSGGITGDRLNMNTVFVKDANIVNVNANKINAGEIDTDKVKVKSADGAVEIAGATQQFRDKNNKVRIQMGKDTKGDFNFILRGEDGTTTLIDHTGVKEKAIADNLINENMIAPDAVGEKALDYNSFASGFNKDTNTSTLKATKVRLDNHNQTLDVAFTSLKSQADGTKTTTESNTTQINVANGKIETAIANTKIVKDGKEVLLKDDYNTTIATVNSMKNTISSHTTKIDANTGKIGTVESKTNVLERDLNSMSSKLSSTETTVKNHTTQISTVQNAANTANNKIDNLEIGGRNVLLNTALLKDVTNFSLSNTVRDNTKKTLSGNNSFFTTVTGLTSDSWRGAIQTINSNKIELGSFYTMSVAILIPSGTIVDLGIVLEIKCFDKDSKVLGNAVQSANPSIVDKWQVISKTREIPLNTAKIECRTYAIRNGKYYHGDYIFEKGTKKSDWTPAPEDAQQQIDKNVNDISTVNTEVTTTKNKVSGIEQNLDSITTRVGSVENTTTTHTATINNHTSSINAVDGKINTAKIQAINDGKNYTNIEVAKVVTSTNSKFAEIKVTTDSITNRVSSTEQITTTLTTNVSKAQSDAKNAQNTASAANSQASTNKVEITKTNSKVASVETNLSGITSRVSNVESTTSSLNGKVIAHENRIASAEQKITPNAIINTVQSTVNQAKNEAINSANASADNKLNNYTTKSEFTALEQTSKDFQFKVETSGTENYIRSADGQKVHHTDDWGTRRFGTDRSPSFNVIHSSESEWAYPDVTVQTLQLKEYYGNSFSGGDMGIIQENIRVQKGETYTASVLVAGHRHNDCYFWIRGLVGSPWGILAGTDFTPPSGGGNKDNWALLKLTFIAQLDYVAFELGMKGSGAANPFLWFTKPMLNKGSIPTTFTTNSKEIHSGITKIDSSGVRCDFDDGTYAIMGRNGLRYYTQGMSRPYQYITFTTNISRCRNGHWVNIILPACFQGKQIDVDFAVTAWAGAVNSNDFAEKQKDAVRNLFIQGGGWNSSNRELRVRACLQKIGVATHTHWGWDSSTTTGGNAIGEGSIDIIVCVQM